MRRPSLVVFCCFVLCGGLGAQSLASEVSTLRILNKSFDPGTRTLDFELWNASDRVVTAWRLSLARSDVHGHGQKSVLDQDFALASRRGEVDVLGSESAQREEGPIGPGESITGSWRVDVGDEGLGHVALSIKVVAVVFEDLTHDGDAEAAAAILAARTARVQEIGRLLSGLESESARRRPRQAWTAALRQRAEMLRREGEQAAISEGVRPETKAQLSATRVELADWLTATGDEMALAPDPTDALERLTAALREQFEAGRRSVADAGVEP